MNEMMRAEAAIHAGRAAEAVLQLVAHPATSAGPTTAERRQTLHENLRSIILFEMDRLILALEKGGA